MNYKLLLVVLLFSFGLLQASDSKSSGIPVEDAEIAKSLEEIEKKMVKSFQSGQRAMAKIAMRKSNFTKNPLVNSTDNLIDNAKQKIETNRL